MVSAELEDQKIEAQIAEIRERRSSGFSTFITGDGEVDGALEGNRMGFTSTAVDRVTIYRTDNGEPCTILTNMYAKTIRKRHPQGHPLAGQKVFSDSPTVPYKMGIYPCFLNPNSSERDSADEAGLAGIVCTADKLASQYDADEHARHRHGREYRAWQEYRTRRDAEEDRRLRREEIEAMKAMASANSPRKAG